MHFSMLTDMYNMGTAIQQARSLHFCKPEQMTLVQSIKKKIQMPNQPDGGIPPRSLSHHCSSIERTL